MVERLTRARFAGERHLGRHEISRKRQVGRRGDGLHSGNRAEPAQHRARVGREKLPPVRRGRAVDWDVCFDADDVLRVEAEVDGLETHERLNEEDRADEQHQRDGQLDADDGPLQPRVDAQSRGAFARRAECRLHLGARQAQCRGEAGTDGCGHDGQATISERRRAHACLRQPGHVLAGQPDEHRQEHAGERPPGGAAQQSEYRQSP